MNLKFASRSSLGYSMALFVAASVLISLSVFGKNSPAYNRAFNACSKQMEDAYADCLNKPYNGVEMCQNVASGVYKRCMRAKGFYAREGEVPPVKTGNGTKPTTSTGTTAVGTATPTPHKPKLSPDRANSVAPVKAATPTPTPTPRPKGTIPPIKKSNG